MKKNLFNDGMDDYGPAEKKKPLQFMIKIPIHKVWGFFKKWRKRKKP